MSLPTFHVDFNELLQPDLVLLSKADEREDSDGNLVTLVEGMRVKVWEIDLSDDGQRDDLVATGAAVRNTAGGWSAYVKWCCLIDESGIQHQSDIKPKFDP
jgi:hypothetical protein